MTSLNSSYLIDSSGQVFSGPEESPVRHGHIAYIDVPEILKAWKEWLQA